MRSLLSISPFPPPTQRDLRCAPGFLFRWYRDLIAPLSIAPRKQVPPPPLRANILTSQRFESSPLEFFARTSLEKRSPSWEELSIRLVQPALLEAEFASLFPPLYACHPPPLQRLPLPGEYPWENSSDPSRHSLHHSHDTSSLRLWFSTLRSPLGGTTSTTTSPLYRAFLSDSASAGFLSIFFSPSFPVFFF